EDEVVVDFKDNPLQVDVGEAGTLSFDFDGDLGAMLAVEGNFNLNIADFFQVDGMLSFSKTSTTVKESDGTLTEADVLSFGALDVNAFAGLNGPGDNPEAFGLNISDADFGLAIINPTDEADDRSFMAMKAKIDSAEFLGAEDIELRSDNLQVIVNQSFGSDESTVIDFSETPLAIGVGSGESLELDMDGARGELIKVEGSAELDMFGLFNVSGLMAVEMVEDRFLIGIAGAKVFAGGDNKDGQAVGLEVSVDEMGILIDTSGDQAGYALSGSGGVELVGLDGLDAQGLMNIEVNTTGMAVDETIEILNPDGSGSTQVNLNFATAQKVMNFAGDLNLSIPDFLDLSGHVQINSSPSGRVDIIVPEAKMALYAAGEELASVSGQAAFNIDPVTGFSLDALQIDSFSIMGMTADIPDSISPPIFLPEAELIAPFDKDLVNYTEFLAAPYIDVYFSTPDQSGIDKTSILDSEAEFLLWSAGESIEVSGIPEEIAPDTWRYTLDTDELSTLPMGEFGEWKIKYIENSFANNQGDLNLAAEQSFAVQRDGVRPVADLAGQAAAEIVDIMAMNSAGYIDVTFTDYSGQGLDYDSILDSDAEFTLSGTGVADAGLDTAILGTPELLYGNTFRYTIEDIFKYNQTDLFVNGEVELNFIEGSWADNAGNTGMGKTEIFLVEETASSAKAQTAINLGPLSMSLPTFTIAGLNYRDSNLIVTLAVGADQAELAFGGGSSGGISTSLTGLLGTFDLAVDVLGYIEGNGSVKPTGAWEIEVESFELVIPNVVEASATGVVFGYDPFYDPGSDPQNPEAALTGQQILSIDQASLSFPLINISGEISSYDPDGSGGQAAIPGLVIWEKGFRFGTTQICYGCEGDEPAINIGNILKFDDIRVGISNFEVIFGQQLEFNGDIFIASGGAEFLPGQEISAKITDSLYGTTPDGVSEAVDTEAIRATLNFADGRIDGFQFIADNFVIDFASVLTFSTRNVFIDTQAGAGEILASFGSVKASITLVGGLGISGEGRNFAFLGDGSFKALAGFGVFFGSTGAVTGESLGLPSWIPVSVTRLGIEWPDIEQNPLNFVLTTSVAVTGIEGSPLTFTGLIEDLKISPWAILEGRFPILDIGAAGVGVSGDLFGGRLSGSLMAGLLKVGYDDQLIEPDAPLDTPVRDRVLFFGIGGGFKIADAEGFYIRLALSQWGPLGVLINVNVPAGVLLDVSGTTGISINDFVAGVEFYSSLPDIHNAEDLRDLTISASMNLSVDEWLDDVKQQVLTQHLAIQRMPVPILCAPFAVLTEPIVISGAGRIYTMYATQQAFNAQAEIRISTDGKFFASGIFNFAAGYISIGASLYGNLANVGGASFYFTGTFPYNNNFLSFGGGFEMGFTNAEGGLLQFPEFDPLGDLIDDIGNWVDDLFGDDEPVNRETPRILLAGPENGGNIDAGLLEGAMSLTLSYIPGTGNSLDKSSISDTDTVMTITAPDGSSYIINTMPEESEYGVGWIYSLPDNFAILSGEYQVQLHGNTFRDSNGTANEEIIQTFTVVGPTATPVDPGRGGSISIGSIKESGYLEVSFAATVGKTLEKESILDEAPELFLTTENGETFSLSGTPEEVTDTTYRYFLPEDLVLTPGVMTITMEAGSISDSGGYTNPEDVFTFSVYGTTAELVEIGKDGIIGISTLNTQGYIDVQYQATEGNTLSADSILDYRREFVLSGSAAANVIISDGNVEALGDDIFRYHFTGEFTSGDLNIEFQTGSWSDKTSDGLIGYSGITQSFDYDLVRLTADLKEPLPFNRVDRATMNSLGYFLVDFGDPVDAGLDEASITDSALEFGLTGEGVGTVTVAGDAQKVVIDGRDYWKYEFAGAFANGIVNINFLEGSWADNLGNTGEARTVQIDVFTQAASYEFRISGFMAMEALGLTPDLDGDGEPDPLLKTQGEITLTLDAVYDPHTLLPLEASLNMDIDAELEMFYLGTIGRTTGRFVLEAGNAHPTTDSIFGSVEDFANALPRMHGALKIDTNLEKLQNLGLTVEGEAYLQINTGFEEVTEIIRLEGIKGDYIFTIDENVPGIIESLPMIPAFPSTSVSSSLRQVFAANGYELSNNLSVVVDVAFDEVVSDGRQWHIYDNGVNPIQYFIKEQDGQLLIYSDKHRFDMDPLSFAIASSGTLGIYGLAELEGDFRFDISTEKIDLQVNAELQTILGNMGAAGSLQILFNEGVVGNLQLGTSAGTDVIGTDIFGFTGTFQLEVNTTATEKMVSVLDITEDGVVLGLKDGLIAAETLRISMGGSLNLFNTFEFKGSALLSLSSDGFQANLDMLIDLGPLGTSRTQGEGIILNTEEEGPVMAMNLETNIDMGVGPILNLNANGLIQFNTSQSQNYVGVDPDSFNMAFDGNLRVLNFEIGAKGSIIQIDDYLEFRIDEAGFDLFGLARVDLDGYFRTNGDLYIKGSGDMNIDLLLIKFESTAEVILGGENFNIVNNPNPNEILSMKAQGAVKVVIPLIGEITVGGAAANFELTGFGATMGLDVYVLGATIHDDIFLNWGGDGAAMENKSAIFFPVDAGGENLELIGEDVFILAPVKSEGASLTLVPESDEGDISFGGSGGTGFAIDDSELSLIEDGFGEIVLGKEGGSYNIALGDASGDSEAVNIKDPLVIQNNGDGGSTKLYADLQGADDASLTINGSGHTTTINSDINMGSDV
ncbi:MAG: hypothetical protein HN936_06090, partial [Bacteroidetes bacterium]|nr:hypothetical protein [Bacteroidota bacterium]